MALDDFCADAERIAAMLAQASPLDKEDVKRLRKQMSPTLERVYHSLSLVYQDVMDLDDMYNGNFRIMAEELDVPETFVREYLEALRRWLEPYFSTITAEIEERAPNIRFSPTQTLH